MRQKFICRACSSAAPARNGFFLHTMQIMQSNPMTNTGRTEAEKLFSEGLCRMEAGEAAAAEKCFRSAIEIAPGFAQAHANLGLLMDKLGNRELAEACYRRALELDPANALTYLNFGAFLFNEKRLDEAETVYRKATALSPASAVIWSNLGALYACIMGREADAELCYRTSMALDGAYTLARFNLSYLLLSQGRFKEGWDCLEARKWYRDLVAHLACPRWQGEPLAGKSLLIGYEAGHGDMIQFCRYVPLLKAQGAASIAIICHPALKTLFATLDGLDTIISFDEAVPATGWDFWVPVLSLPYHFKTRINSIPASIPYLHATPERIAQWATLLPEGGFRVGLVWKGNPRFENDADRSLPSLDVLAPLWAVAGVRFVSLQKGAGEEEAARPHAALPLIDLGSRFVDFADTAAAVMNLDLIICVDTAVAHLAGALGKPCWVLLPAYKADWRWLRDRTDSPWYPTLRLFRQTTMGDWTDAVDTVLGALEQRAAESLMTIPHLPVAGRLSSAKENLKNE